MNFAEKNGSLLKSTLGKCGPLPKKVSGGFHHKEPIPASPSGESINSPENSVTRNIRIPIVPWGEFREGDDSFHLHLRSLQSCFFKNLTHGTFFWSLCCFEFATNANVLYPPHGHRLASCCVITVKFLPLSI